MNSQDVSLEIQQLESIRKQIRIWRGGATILLLVGVLFCLWTIKEAVNGLTQPGPAQTEYAQQLSTRLQGSVVPQLQTLATQTLTEMRPQLETEFTKLNERVPELTEGFLQELETLQTNIPKHGEDALGKTLGSVLTKKDSQIRTMFPNATEANIKSMIENVQNEAATSIASTHSQLFSKHMTALNGIVGSLTTIHESEKVNPQSDAVDWEMLVLVSDLIGEDIKSMRPDLDANGKKMIMTSAPAGTKSAMPGATGSKVPAATTSAAIKPGTVKLGAMKPAAQPQNKKEAKNGAGTTGY